VGLSRRVVSSSGRLESAGLQHFCLEWGPKGHLSKSTIQTRYWGPGHLPQLHGEKFGYEPQTGNH